MVGQDEYKKVIDSFMSELMGTCAALTNDKLDGMPEFRKELAESIRGLRDPNTSPAAVVGLSFGVVDEFVHAAWENVLKDCYDLYVASVRARSDKSLDRA
jgi:hypothetical protein